MLDLSSHPFTSDEVRGITGDYQGADAITRLKSQGYEIVSIGFVHGSKQKKLYRLANRDELIASVIVD